MNNNDTKKCKKCGIAKSLNCFYKYNKTKYRNSCKQCESNRINKYNKNKRNPQKVDVNMVLKNS